MFLPIDEGFVTHRKTLRFCGLMQDPNAVAYLLRLWSWAVRSAPDGDLSSMEPIDIEYAVAYRNADGKCYEAMVKAGFIEESAPGKPGEIHDWMEHTGGDIAKMEAAAEASRKRKREWAAAQRTRAGTLPSAGVDAQETASRRDIDAEATPPERHADAPRQDQSSQVKASPDRSGSAPLFSPSEASGSRAPARSESRAKVWTPYDWFQRFGIGWRERYASWPSGDGAASGKLGDLIAALPDDATRIAAQARADAMIAEFMASEDPRTVARRHPWSFFVQEWGGLRVPKLDVKPAAPKNQAVYPDLTRAAR